MNDDIAIKVDNVTKKFVLPHEKNSSVKSIFTSLFKKKKKSTPQTAIKNISFDIKKGEFFGIVGRNGSGKSTLLKIIAEIYQPTSGKVSRAGKLVPFIELGVGFNPELTGRENVYLNGAILGFTRNQIKKNYNKIVEFAELEEHMDAKLKNYSSGMQVRLAFACATMAKADILLIDEVLAVGDADFQRKCFSYFKQLKREGKTVVFVTHDMGAIREYCDKAMLINDHRIVAIGTPSKISKEYSLLFAGENSIEINSTTVDKYRGNGSIKITSASVDLVDNHIVINVLAKATQNVERALYGMHVIAEDGKEVTAFNNRMISHADIVNTSKGDILEFQWNLLNIFNDGLYFIDLTIVDSNGTTLDWLTGATNFSIKREERSTTNILPPISVSLMIKDNRGSQKHE